MEKRLERLETERVERRDGETGDRTSGEGEDGETGDRTSGEGEAGETDQVLDQPNFGKGNQRYNTARTLEFVSLFCSTLAGMDDYVIPRCPSIWTSSNECW